MTHIREGRRFNIHASATIDGVLYPHFTDRSLWEKLGISEAPEPEMPAEMVADPTYWLRRETDEAPYVEFVKMPDEEIALIEQRIAKGTINDLERSTMLPRASREFMLGMMVQLAMQQGLDEPTLYDKNPGYRKVKDLDEEIKTLRGVL